MTSLHKQKIKLHKQNPRCYWCQTPTILYEPKQGEKTPDNMATIDHLFDRFHPERKTPNHKKLIKRVLACHRCNNKRSAQSCLDNADEHELRSVIGLIKPKTITKA